MQCESFERRMHDLLDRRLLPEEDPELRIHAQQCVACRRTLATQTILMRTLVATMPAAVIASETTFSRRARNAGHGNVPPAARRLHSLAAWSGALVAASLLLMLAFAGWTDRAVERDRSLVKSPELAGPRRPEAPGLASPAWSGRLSAPIGIEPFRAHLNSTPHPMIGVGLIAATGWERALGVTANLRFERTNSESRWLQQVHTSVQPIAQSLDSAWTVFRHTVLPPHSSVSATGEPQARLAAAFPHLA